MKPKKLSGPQRRALKHLVKYPNEWRQDTPTNQRCLNTLDTLGFVKVAYKPDSGWCEMITDAGIETFNADTQEANNNRIALNIKKVCKNCKHFNWKLSGSRHWGECLNPEVIAATRLSLKLVNLGKPQLDEVAMYARIHFDENEFGCFRHSQVSS